MNPYEAVNHYQVAWMKLRKLLEDHAAKLPDKSPEKRTVLETIFTMDTLDPKNQ